MPFNRCQAPRFKLLGLNVLEAEKRRLLRPFGARNDELISEVCSDFSGNATPF